MDSLTLYLLAVFEGPVVLVALLAELFYFFRLGVIRSHPVRVAVAMLGTAVIGLPLSGIVAILLPGSLQPTHYEPVGLPLILIVLPGLISCALLAPPLCWWAAQRRKILVRVIAVLYVCVAGAGYYEMGPSSRSPVRLARSVSGLSVPRDARALEFHDQASGPFDSDLDMHADLALSPAAAISLSNEARRSGYLSMASSFPSRYEVARAAVTGLVVSEGERAARWELGDDRAGLYQYAQTGARSYNVAVLDSARGRLYIRILIM